MYLVPVRKAFVVFCSYNLQITIVLITNTHHDMYSFSSPTRFHINLVTADGIKGKTWGPSTLHQRERGYLPALNQTTVTSTPQFSKSAPNLDKSRANLGLPSAAATATATTTTTDANDAAAAAACAAAAAAAIVDSQQLLHSSSSSSHNNVLGKSVEGLNKLKIMTSGSSSSSNSTSKTHRYNIGSLDALHCDGERYTYDDDEDDVEVKGCFGFIRSDDGYVKRKKHSLDSRMTEHSHQSANLINLRTPVITAAPAPPATPNRTTFDRMSEVCVAEIRNCDEPPYDRVFYRNIQKSLEEIFARDDFNQRFASQKSRNSKSSGDLTMYNEEDDVYGQYQFQRSNSKSEFHRECFFVNHNADDSSEESERNASIKSNTSSNARSQEYVARKQSLPLNERLLDTNDALIDNSTTNSSISSKYYRSHDDRTNSICSDDHSSTDMSITPSASRKNSVTFRVDGSINGIANTSTAPPNQLIYANLETTSFDVPPRNRLSKPKSNNHTRYALIDHHKNQMHPNNVHKPTNGLVTTSGVSVLKSALSKKEKKDKPSSSIISAKSKCIGLTRFLKFPRKAAVLHSNSFYSKGEDKTEMNEQLLLDDDKTTHSTSSSTNDPIYDSVFRTKNFLLAKSNDT